METPHKNLALLPEPPACISPSCKFNIVPLLETIEDLENSIKILEDFWGNIYESGDSVEVMIGYSDSNKDGGILKSQWDLYTSQSLISSLARVIIGPLIGFYIIYYFNLSGFAAGVLLIQCSMPSAILNFLIGSLYSPKKTVDDVASMIFVSTVLSFITIPVVVFIALKYFS